MATDTAERSDARSMAGRVVDAAHRVVQLSHDARALESVANEATACNFSYLRCRGMPLQNPPPRV